MFCMVSEMSLILKFMVCFLCLVGSLELVDY